MNKWQERFARKVGTARQASADRFQQIADEALVPVFTEFQEFTTQQGLESSAPMTKKGLRTYKFAISENAYALLTFRVAGIEHCEIHVEFFVPHHDKLQPQVERAELGAFDGAAARCMFERALDGFMDVYLETLDTDGVITGEPVAAQRR